VLECPQVRFRRSPGMLPLPVPGRGGSVEALRSFLNLSSQNDFVLVSDGCWPRCDQGGPIRCWQYRASRARRRPFYQSSSGR
jgi:hypothetical protein